MGFFGVEPEEDEAYDHMDEEAEDAPESTPRIRKVHRSERSERLRPVVTGTPQRMHIVEPTSFNDTQAIADKFRIGIPIIVNLQRAERDAARRIVDFISGVVYIQRGGIVPVGPKVFLLTPRNVEIGPEDKRRLRAEFFNQF